MKIDSLRLRGFIGIQRGLSLDEIKIDFRDVSGLIAFDGQNGAGKSTVLENLHPFPQLASRDGALFRHVFTRSAEKELCFTYAGHAYRTLLKIDAQSEKQEGYIWKDGASEVNGKISEYGKYIKALLGSPDLFFASVFCAQNSKKLSDLTTGKLKELFAEFLRLDRLQEWEGTAKQCAAIMQYKAGAVDNRLGVLSEKLAGKDALEEQDGSLRQRIEFQRDDKTLLLHDLEEKRQTADALKDAIAKNAANVARKADLERSIARMTEDMAGEQKATEGEIEALKAKYRELMAEVQKAYSVLTYKVKIEGAAEEEKRTLADIEKLQQEIDRVSGEYEKAKEKDHAIGESLQTLRQELKDLNNDPELADIIKKIEGFEQDLSNTEIWITTKTHETESLRLRDKDCQSDTCPFIRSALEAIETLPRLQENLGLIRVEIVAHKNIADQRRETLTGLKTALQEKIEKLEAEQTANGQSFLNLSGLLDGNRGKLSTARKSLESLKALSARLPEIAIAENRKQDLEIRIAEVTNSGILKRNAWTERKAILEAAITGERVKMGEIVIDGEATDKLKVVAAEIQAIETVRIPAIDKQIQESREKIVTIQSELARIAEAEKELAAVRDEKDRLTREISEWTYLKNACGKTGLQALEIDGAAPLITAKANELLAKSFGRTYSVKMLTQDSEGRETLDLMVIGEDGSEDLLENKSGGEKVFCLMALRLAMTLLSKEKSGLQFLTAFSDESDGALDPENALNYVAMYRSFMQVGGFENFLFISHRPECRNMADHILKFESGRSPYWI